MATVGTQHERFEDRLPFDVFVVTPNAKLLQDLREKLGPPRWNLAHAAGGAQALEVLREAGIDDGILLLDPNLPDLEVKEFHSMVRSRFPNSQILMLNPQNGQLLVGAASPTLVSRRLAEAVNGSAPLRAGLATGAVVSFNSRTPTEGRARLRNMIGDSEPMQRVYSHTRLVAARNTTVLITGESGTGKDLVAQEIHLISMRRNQPFVVVNCSAIPEALLEAELFGYTKGSFTGALQSRIGRIHAAHGGTLFLDEIGDLPVSLQSKILRFLEQGEVQRIGGNDNLKVDVRVVAATNAELKKRVAQQQFREDLYFRLAVFPIHLPPLRDRMSDLPELALAFAAKSLPGVTLTQEAIDVLMLHDWPGNVRELRNAIERGTILIGTGNEIRAEHIIL
ncbi:MAG: sigma-54 dependent transcriptional regulator [Terracidiphilus sp.]|jgi:DNA-binding NtrC family response regulator